MTCSRVAVCVTPSRQQITTPVNKRPAGRVILPTAESRNEPPKLGTRFGRGLVVAQARGVRSSQCEVPLRAPLPAPLTPLLTVSLHCQRAVHPNETKLPTWGGETTDLQGTDLARRGRIFCLTVLASQLGSFGKHGQYHISG